MTHIAILILNATDDRAARARQDVLRRAPLAGAVLFGGDRWAVATVCLLATRDEPLAGLATLAPTDETGAGGPHVIGVWVARPYRRQGIGGALLRACIAESGRRMGAPPAAIVCTPSGLARCAKLQDEGLDLALAVAGVEID